MLVFWIWFSLLEGISLKDKQRLLAHYHTPDKLYALDAGGILYAPVPCPQVLNKDLSQAESVLQQCMQHQIGILTLHDSGYPSLLKRIPDAPVVLYYRGTLPNWELQPAIGVVGTRHASDYGLRTAFQISSQIAACGGLVVSGGAFGIDAQASQGALSQNKTTVAVLASGLDRLTPASHRPLFESILHCGCLLSEHPPHAEIFKGNFLQRNRIISGICNGILVVEAPASSGALNTAHWAKKQDRALFAVPGELGRESCAGSNALITQGATAVLSGWQLLQPYASRYPLTVHQAQPQTAAAAPLPQKAPARSRADKINIDKPKDSPYIGKDTTLPELTEPEKAVVALLSSKPVPMDLITEQLDMPQHQAMSLITKLTIKGVVKNHPGRLISLN